MLLYVKLGGHNAMKRVLCMMTTCAETWPN